MTTAVAIRPTINVILIMENQNSASPNTFTAMRLMAVNTTRKHSSISHFQPWSSMPNMRKNVTKYVLTAVISVMPVRMSTIQYVQPANLPHARPR